MTRAGRIIEYLENDWDFRLEDWQRRLLHNLYPEPKENPVTVTIYTGPACGACVATKHQFKKHGIEYVEAPAADHVDALRAMGHTSKPVVVADLGDETVHWSGLDLDSIKALAWLMAEEDAA